MIKRKTKNNKKSENNSFSAGIVLETEKLVQQESRGLTLFIKGILVYLIVMGAMGCLLSAVNVQYHSIVVHVVLLFAGIFCAFLYYSKRWENIGYILLLGVMFATGIGLRKYINSGFYAVANDLAEAASSFFESNAMRSFGEQMENRQLAVTISMCYIGSVCCIFMNILISRRMQYLLAIPFSIGSLLFPLYLELEPSLGYVSMLLSGILVAYMIRGNGHYQLTRNNRCYEFDRKKQQIRYIYAGKMLAQVLISVFLVCFLLLQLVGVIYPKKHFQKNHSMSKIKAQSLDTVENLSLLGVMGLFNFYPNTGGLTNGTLGGVSAIRLDYNTDLTVEFTPYSYDRVYLKTFTGAKYLPYTNRWSRLEEEEQKEEKGINTVKELKKAYKNNGEKSARGKMKITNVAAAVGGYLPYYSKEELRIYPGETKEYIYYPYLTEEIFSYEGEKNLEMWMEVPAENQETIKRFCEGAGFSPIEGDIIQQVIAYYQAEIPYTYRPGATPWRQDFVNYFLEKNKKGYCAHFASAATLIFRYYGIPARYVEGYAIDADEISEDGKVLTDKKYADYYDGYSELGETGVVSQNVTDADAHAWVEIYVEGRGWTPVEVTPYSGEEAEEENNLWSMFMRLFAEGKEDIDSNGEGQESTAVFDDGTREVSRNTAFIVSAVIIILVLGQWMVRKGIYWWKYHKSDRNEKLVLQYQKYLHKMLAKHREVEELPNYARQIQWLCQKKCLKLTRQEEEKCIQIVEQAGFSNREISEEDFNLVLSWIRTRKDWGKS